MVILQDLLKFHREDDSLDAYIDVDMKRLSFVHLNSVHPEKDLGYYLILASPDEKFKPVKNAMAYGYTQITNIAYTVRKDNDYKYDFYVYNRETGDPLAGVTAKLWKEKYNYLLRRYNLVKYKTFTTNKEGYFHVPPTSQYGVNFYVEFVNDKDKIHTNEQFYQYKPYSPHYNE